jgi:hypothetical protein
LVASAVSLVWLPTAAASAIFEFEGHTYRIVTDVTDWETANLLAEEMSLNGQAGYLARVDSQRENTALLEALATHVTGEQLQASIPDDGSEVPFVWLGGSDIEQEGAWTWSNNGDQFWQGDFNGAPKNGLYSNWGVQPDSGSGAEDGLAMGLGDWPEPFYDLGALGEWNDLDIDSALIYIVEFDSVTDLEIAIDQPIRNAVHSGIGMVRGWAMSSKPIERIEVYIDGTYRFDIPHGDQRNDLAKRFPDNELASESGFSTAFNWNQLGSGEHEITIRAIDTFGSSAERTFDFAVTTFDKGFIQSSDVFELGWSSISGLGDSFLIRGALIDGAYYDITLQWRPRSQNFEIVGIRNLSAGD